MARLRDRRLRRPGDARSAADSTGGWLAGRLRDLGTAAKLLLTTATTAAVATVVTAVVAPLVTSTPPGDGSSADGRQGSDEPIRFAMEYAPLSIQFVWVLPGRLSPQEDQQVRGTTPLEADRLTDILAAHDPVRVAAAYPFPRATTELRLVIVGNRDSPVLVTGLAAKVVARHPVLAGTMVATGSRGGEGDVVQVGIDLDDKDPVARQMDRTTGALRDPYFLTKQVTLTRGEPIVFHIHAVTDGCYCEWTIEVTAFVDGERQTFTVQDGNRPFRTTALADRYQAAYVSAGDREPFTLRPDGRLRTGDR